MLLTPQALGVGEFANHFLLYFILDKVGSLHREPAGRKEFSVALCSRRTECRSKQTNVIYIYIFFFFL